MDFNATFTTDEIEQMFHIVREATRRTTSSPLAERRRWFLETLAKHVGADAWLWSTSSPDRRVPDDAVATAVIEGGWESAEEQMRVFAFLTNPHHIRNVQRVAIEAMAARKRATFELDELLPPGCESEREIWKATGFEHILLSLYPIDGGFSSNMGLYRRCGKPIFSPRERQFVYTVFGHLDWLHDYAANPLARDATLELSARERQTLLYLLSGLTHKEIAQRMGISRYTVSDYVKSVHQHFRVSSRGELQAMVFLGRKE